jgi:hypothetical protein
VELRAEEWQFNLTLAGRPAGMQRLTTGFERGLYVMRLEAQFQGALGVQKRLQVSKLEPNLRLPAVFTENDNGRVFETTFDRRDGLVRLRQNRDEAVNALTQDYHDPVSVLQFLRDLPDDVRSARVPMIGGTVLVTRLDDETVDSPWGPQRCRVYYLRPGVSLVYIEADEPRRILKLTQSLGKYALEAALTRVTEGAVLPQDERGANESAKQNARRDGGRRDGGRQDRDRQDEARRDRHQPRARRADRPEVAQVAPQAAVSGEGRSKRRRNRHKSGDRAGSGAVKPDAAQTAAPRVPETPRQPPVAVEGAAANPAKRRRRARRRGGKGNGNSGGTNNSGGE